MIFRLYFFLFWFHIFTKCCQQSWTDQEYGASHLDHGNDAPYMPAFGNFYFGTTDAYETMQAQPVTGKYTANGSVLNARDYNDNHTELLTPVRSDAMNTSQAYMVNNRSTYVQPGSLVAMRGYYENYSPFNNRRLYAPYDEPLLMARSQVPNIQEQERQWVYGPYEDTNAINTDEFGVDIRKRPHYTIQNALTSQKRASAYTALDSNATRRTKRPKLLQPGINTRPDPHKPQEAHNEGFTSAAQEFKTIMTKQQNNYITQESQAAENASRFPYPSLAAHYETIGLEAETLDLTNIHRKRTIKPKKKWETKFTESDNSRHEIQLANNITEIGKLTSTSTTHNSNQHLLYEYTGTVQDVNPVSCAANIIENHLSIAKMRERNKMPIFSLDFLGDNKLIADALYERIVFSRKHGASELDSDESNRFLDVLQGINKFVFDTRAEKLETYFTMMLNKPDSKIKLTKYKDDSKLKIFTKAKEHLRTKNKSIYLCKKIYNIHKLYHAKISALTEFEDKRKVFAEFVRKVMFCEQEKNGGIAVKPEVWSVQLFMFEIIIYILWRLEMPEMPIYDNGFEYSFEKEMQHILYLLFFFHKYGHISKVFDESQTNNGVVHEYRTFILQSLMSQQHYKSAPYYFYKHAYNVQCSCTHKSSLIKKKNMLLMIAFTSHKTSLNIFARNIACDEMENKKEFYLQQFFHRRLCENATYKSELVAILFSTVEFLNLLKHGQSRTNDESMLFAPFKKVTLFVSPIFSKGKLKIQTMSSNEMMNYFFNVVYTLHM